MGTTPVEKRDLAADSQLGKQFTELKILHQVGVVMAVAPHHLVAAHAGQSDPKAFLRDDLRKVASRVGIGWNVAELADRRDVAIAVEDVWINSVGGQMPLLCDVAAEAPLVGIGIGVQAREGFKTRASHVPDPEFASSDH